MRTRNLLVPIVTGVVACSPPVMTFEGERVVVLAEPGLELCGGSLAHMDGFVERMAAELQRPSPSGDERIMVRWFAEGHRVLLPCPGLAFGCASDGEVFSVWAPHNHELVHALTHVYGRSPPFFEEGLANAYQGLDPNADSLPAASLGMATHVQDTLCDDAARLDNLTAAGFVSMLVSRHGMAKFLDVYSVLSRRSCTVDVDEAFRSILGTTLEESIADFESLPSDCIQSKLDAKVMECEAPALEWDDTRLALFRELDCAHDDAVGPYDGDHLQVLHTLTVTEPGDFELRAIAERPDSAVEFNAVVLTPCEGCVGGASVTVYAGENVRSKLAAGRYSLRLMGPAAVPTHLGFLLARIHESEGGA